MQDKTYGPDALTDKEKDDIINKKDCTILHNKVKGFFLKTGAKHSKDFFDVGYTPEDTELLTGDLRSIYDYKKAVDKVYAEDGSE